MLRSSHQDYGLRGHVNVVETHSSILITNEGAFLPDDGDKVIQQDAPLEIYTGRLTKKIDDQPIQSS